MSKSLNQGRKMDKWERSRIIGYLRETDMTIREISDRSGRSQATIRSVNLSSGSRPNSSGPSDEARNRWYQ